MQISAFCFDSFGGSLEIYRKGESLSVGRFQVLKVRVGVQQKLSSGAFQARAL
jgi:hypothetical protein